MRPRLATVGVSVVAARAESIDGALMTDRPYRFPTEEEDAARLAEPVELPEEPDEPEPEIDKSGPIRRYLDSGIQASIDKALASLPEGKAGAVIAYANGEGARLAVLGRVGIAEWTVVVDKPWHGPVGAEAALRFSW